MEEINRELQRIITNAKKSGSRKYTKETIIQKVILIKQLSKKYGKLIATLPKIAREEKINQFKELKHTALDTIIRNSKEFFTEETLELGTMSNEETVENRTMSNFNGKQASDTIPTFDGKAKHIDTFLSMVELVYDELNEQGKKHLIKYVIAMKLNDRVRDILTIEQTPTTLSELRTSLTKNFKSTRTASSIYFELKNTKQKGNVLNYKEKITSLIADLTLAQISELGHNTNEIPRATIKQMNEKLALEIFQEGLYENIRIAVIAAQPKTLSQAYDIAITQERSLHLSDTFKTLQINRNNKNNIEFRNNKYSRQNNFYGQHSRNNNNYNDNNNRYNIQERQDFNTNRNRNNRNHNNNYNNNNNSRNFNNYNRNRTNTNSRYNTNNAYNRNNRNNYNNNNHTIQRNNHPNVRTIHRQGNGETLEIQNESLEGENYRFTQ